MYKTIFMLLIVLHLYNCYFHCRYLLLRVSAFIYAFLNTHCDVNSRYICLANKQINNIYAEICARSI